MDIKELGEFGLINRIAKKLKQGPGVLVGIGDDTAVLAPSGEEEILFTTDMMVEGVHFSREFADLSHAGWKALAVNVSDIGAMGGRPTYAVISLGIPEDCRVEEIDQLYQGLHEAADFYGVSIVGGDIVKSLLGLVINVALQGQIMKGKAVLRSGAQVGDLVMVTGTLGDSQGGLEWFLNLTKKQLITEDLTSSLKDRHLRPKPPALIGRILAERGWATSMNDISDGIASEIIEICQASKVGCVLEKEKLPLSDSVKEWARILKEDPANWAMYGGEDFQLVFTIRPSVEDPVTRACLEQGVSITKVGVITSEEGYYLKEETDLRPFEAKGFNHFAEK